MKSEEEIQAKADQAADAESNPKYPGMTYEMGVRAALDWVLSDDDDPDEDIL